MGILRQAQNERLFFMSSRGVLPQKDDVAISDKCKNKTSKGKMTSQKLKVGTRFQVGSLLKEQKHFCIFICHFDF